MIIIIIIVIESYNKLCSNLQVFLLFLNVNLFLKCLKSIFCLTDFRVKVKQLGIVIIVSLHDNLYSV